MKKLGAFVLLVAFQLTVLSQNTFIMQLNKSVNSSQIVVIPSQNDEISVWVADSLELYKFDKCGNSLWNKKFDFPDFKNTHFGNIISTQNGGYAFMTRETTGTTISSRVTVLDALGNIIWSKVYSISSTSISAYSLMEDDVGNLFIYGNTSPLGGGTHHNLIVKIQANGNQLWAKHYNHGGIWGKAILTSDNGILARTGSRLIKLNSLGDVQWTSQNWVSGFYHYYAPVEVSDGYIFTASVSPTGFIKFMKIDKFGNQLWGGGKILNFEGVNRKLVKKSNGNIVAVFNKTVNGKNLPTAIEFDKDLNVVKTSSIQTSQPNIKLTGYDINFVNNNNTPVLTGTLDSLGTYKPFIAKLDSNYQSGCDTVLPVSFGTQTVVNSLISTTSQSVNLSDVNSIFNPISFTVNSSILCSSSQLSINLGNDTTLCPNTSITLKNLDASIFDTFLWSTNETSPTISVNSSGTYWVTATDNCTGISFNDTVNVAIQNFSDPANLQKEAILCLDSLVLLDATYPGGTYKWNDGSISPYFSASTLGNYFVDVTYQGCVKRFFTEVISCENYIIPNVFTPNNDGLNDFFKIVYNGNQKYQLNIYNRWGQSLFESNDKNHFWDGKTNSKKVPAGSYFYIFSLGSETVKGSLSLFR
ncbi:MAG: gliding motility-associated C-terminal domain-containing protein [Vicingaceae bacterium]